MTKTMDRQTSKATAAWLLSVAVLVLAMVVVGGATRATGSGLSITQWRPVSGVIPPLTHADWERVFTLYKAIPQYRLLNQGMSLDEFQSIFWWEWSHRLLGRLLGAVFLVPFLILLSLSRIPRRLIWRCGVLFGLGALQGLVGWWMVKSGLEVRTSVAPERLATHLGLALILFSALIWTALEAWFGPSGPFRSKPNGWASASAGFLIAVYVQCLLGALVAGNHAGLVDEDWPLMAGRWLPADYWQGTLWGSLVHGPAAVQFDHRLWAYGLLIAGLTLAAAATAKGKGALQPIAWSVAAILVLQVALGIATLMLTVPLPLALLHQLTATILLASGTVMAWRTRRMGEVL